MTRVIQEHGYISGQTAAIPVTEFTVRLAEACLPKTPACLENILNDGASNKAREVIDDALRTHEIDRRRARSQLIERLEGELNKKGMGGRYVIHDRSCGSSESGLSIVVNSAEVLRVLGNVPYITSVKQAQLAKRVVANQLWECVNPILEEVRIRFRSPALDVVYEKLESGGVSYSRDQRLALIDEANQARRAAIRSIRKYLERSDVGYGFVIPSSQWDGTNDRCSVIGIASVRVALRGYPQVSDCWSSGGE